MRTCRCYRPRTRQRGVVLIFTLIVLLILTIGAVALVRSMNNSLFGAGNLAFRRDLVNQGEQAVSTVINEFKAGGSLSASSVTNNSLPALNYSATILPTNAQGVPIALTDDATFFTVGVITNDLPGATSDIQIRYVIDRLCAAVPPTVVATSALCVQSTALPTGGTYNRNTAVEPPTATVYRLSVRVAGARSTQVFLQTTFTRPD
jgi:type IV pilus assembly protein PilX